MRLFGTMENRDGMLHIGGCSAEELAKKYKTPLYVMDAELIEENLTKFKKAFVSDKFSTEIVYASKAFLTRTMCNLLQKYDFHIDAVTGGELFLIKKSGFPMEKIHMHGNNKSREELLFCIEEEIGSIIADNLPEIEKIEKICNEVGKKTKVMLRLNVGIDAHTHEYIKTSKHSSKFGVSIFGDEIEEVMQKLILSNNIEFLGFHCHIGSQIFDESAFVEAIDVMAAFTKRISKEFSIEIPEINIGGGFGVFYTPEDDELNIESFMKKLISQTEKSLAREGINIKKLIIEPGRSIVANAGTTLYTIGFEKNTYSGEKFLFVDGGMGDNLRPALYHAKYEAVVANKMNNPYKDYVNIAGKCCESGDVLIKNICLSKAEEGDILAVGTTGAYGYSMSNNYNRLVKPAVVFVKNGKDYLSVKREEFEDFLINDIETTID